MKSETQSADMKNNQKLQKVLFDEEEIKVHKHNKSINFRKSNNFIQSDEMENIQRPINFTLQKKSQEIRKPLQSNGSSIKSVIVCNRVTTKIIPTFYTNESNSDTKTSLPSDSVTNFRHQRCRTLSLNNVKRRFTRRQKTSSKHISQTLQSSVNSMKRQLAKIDITRNDDNTSKRKETITLFMTSKSFDGHDSSSNKLIASKSRENPHQCNLHTDMSFFQKVASKLPWRRSICPISLIVNNCIYSKKECGSNCLAETCCQRILNFRQSKKDKVCSKISTQLCKKSSEDNSIDKHVSFLNNTSTKCFPSQKLRFNHITRHCQRSLNNENEDKLHDLSAKNFTPRDKKKNGFNYPKRLYLIPVKHGNDNSVQTRSVAKNFPPSYDKKCSNSSIKLKNQKFLKDDEDEETFCLCFTPKHEEPIENEKKCCVQTKSPVTNLSHMGKNISHSKRSSRLRQKDVEDENKRIDTVSSCVKQDVKKLEDSPHSTCCLCIKNESNTSSKQLNTFMLKKSAHSSCIAVKTSILDCKPCLRKEVKSVGENTIPEMTSSVEYCTNEKIPESSSKLDKNVEVFSKCLGITSSVGCSTDVIEPECSSIQIKNVGVNSTPPGITSSVGCCADVKTPECLIKQSKDVGVVTTCSGKKSSTSTYTNVKLPEIPFTCDCIYEAMNATRDQLYPHEHGLTTSSNPKQANPIELVCKRCSKKNQPIKINKTPTTNAQAKMNSPICLRATPSKRNEKNPICKKNISKKDSDDCHPLAMPLASKVIHKVNSLFSFFTSHRDSKRRALKKMLFAVIAITWCPCILLVSLGWCFSRPFQPNHLMRSKNKGSCINCRNDPAACELHSLWSHFARDMKHLSKSVTTCRRSRSKVIKNMRLFSFESRCRYYKYPSRKKRNPTFQSSGKQRGLKPDCRKERKPNKCQKIIQNYNCDTIFNRNLRRSPEKSSRIFSPQSLSKVVCLKYKLWKPLSNFFICPQDNRRAQEIAMPVACQIKNREVTKQIVHQCKECSAEVTHKQSKLRCKKCFCEISNKDHGFAAQNTTCRQRSLNKRFTKLIHDNDSGSKNLPRSCSEPKCPRSVSFTTQTPRAAVVSKCISAMHSNERETSCKSTACSCTFHDSLNSGDHSKNKVRSNTKNEKTSQSKCIPYVCIDSNMCTCSDKIAKQDQSNAKTIKSSLIKTIFSRCSKSNHREFCKGISEQNESNSKNVKSSHLKSVICGCSKSDLCEFCKELPKHIKSRHSKCNRIIKSDLCDFCKEIPKQVKSRHSKCNCIIKSDLCVLYKEIPKQVKSRHSKCNCIITSDLCDFCKEIPKLVKSRHSKCNCIIKSDLCVFCKEIPKHVKSRHSKCNCIIKSDLCKNSNKIPEQDPQRALHIKSLNVISNLYPDTKSINECKCFLNNNVRVSVPIKSNTEAEMLKSTHQQRSRKTRKKHKKSQSALWQCFSKASKSGRRFNENKSPRTINKTTEFSFCNLLNRISYHRSPAGDCESPVINHRRKKSQCTCRKESVSKTQISKLCQKPIKKSKLNLHKICSCIRQYQNKKTGSRNNCTRNKSIQYNIPRGKLCLRRCPLSSLKICPKLSPRLKSYPIYPNPSFYHRSQPSPHRLKLGPIPLQSPRRLKPGPILQQIPRRFKSGPISQPSPRRLRPPGTIPEPSPRRLRPGPTPLPSPHRLEPGPIPQPSPCRPKFAKPKNKCTQYRKRCFPKPRCPQKTKPSLQKRCLQWFERAVSCIVERVKAADRDAYHGKDLSCENLYMNTLDDQPYFMFYKCCPICYPCLLSMVKSFRMWGRCCGFIFAICFWSPFLLCCYICYSFCRMCT